MSELNLEILGRYKILKVIGRGAMGVVYQAIDPDIDRVVAIKTINLTLSSEEMAEYEARFKQEIKAAGRLNHPNIVTIYDVGKTEKFAYMAMEFLDGKELKDLLKAGNRPAVEDTLDMIAQVADGLGFAHSRDIIHRDVKPSNIMVLEGEEGLVAKVTDFGIARMPTQAVKTMTGMIMGSPRYMSPEQVIGKNLGPPSDIFSLGVVLYETLTGDAPFDGDSVNSIMYATVNTPEVAPSTLNPWVPPALDAIVARALCKKVDERFQTMREFSRALREIKRTLADWVPPPQVESPGAAQTSEVIDKLAISAQEADGTLSVIRVERPALEAIEAQAIADRAAKEAAEKQAAEKRAAEAAEKQAAERRAAEAAEKQAAEKRAAEKRAAEAAEKQAAEKRAAEAAEKQAAERRAAEAAEKQAAERRAAEAAEKQAAEKRAAEAAEKKAAEKHAAEAAEKRAAEAAEKQAAERRAAEKRAAEAAEKQAAEKRAAEAAEKQAAEKRAAEAAEKQAAEKRAAEAAEKQAAEKRAAEKQAAEKQAAEKQAAEKRAAERRAAEKQAAEKRAAEKQAAEKRAPRGAEKDDRGNKLADRFDSTAATMRLAAFTQQTDEIKEFINESRKLAAYTGPIEEGQALQPIVPAVAASGASSAEEISPSLAERLAASSRRSPRKFPLAPFLLLTSLASTIIALSIALIV